MLLRYLAWLYMQADMACLYKNDVKVICLKGICLLLFEVGLCSCCVSGCVAKITGLAMNTGIYNMQYTCKNCLV